MKSLLRLTVALLIAIPASVSAQQTPTASSRITHSQIEPSRDERLAQDWGLRSDEWSRYRELMEGPLGIYSPHLDPLTALGIEARSYEERQRYAELQVQIEARRVEKLLSYQRAYDEAWQRLYPGMQRVTLPDTITSSLSSTGMPRLAVFVQDDCAACEQRVQRLQATGAAFDLYMVGSRADDAHIRAWARRTGIDPAKVRHGTITLNHDAGHWQSLGLSGELPAVVRQVNGKWQRQ